MRVYNFEEDDRTFHETDFHWMESASPIRIFSPQVVTSIRYAPHSAAGKAMCIIMAPSPQMVFPTKSAEFNEETDALAKKERPLTEVDDCHERLVKLAPTLAFGIVCS